jgi:hypothetical protein
MRTGANVIRLFSKFTDLLTELDCLLDQGQNSLAYYKNL